MALAALVAKYKPQFKVIAQAGAVLPSVANTCMKYANAHNSIVRNAGNSVTDTSIVHSRVDMPRC